MPLKKDGNFQYIDLYDVFSAGNRAEKEQGLFLLGKAYREIYLKMFPVPSEQEAFEDWCDNLENAGKNHDVQSFSLYGFDLDRKNPKIVGLIVTSFYKGCACGLIDYLIREKAYSKSLPAVKMLDMQEKILKRICLKFDGAPLKMILWEANDPKRIAWDDNAPDYTKDCMNPQKRVDHIRRCFDCRQIGVDYAQAPIRVVRDQREIDENVCDNLLLFLYKAGKYAGATPNDLERFLISFSKACNGNPPDRLNNRYIDRMMRQISVMKSLNIPLLHENQTDEQRQALKNA